MPARTPSRPGPLRLADCAAFRADFARRPACRLAQNAVTQVAAATVAGRHEVLRAADHSFSLVLDDWPATNQKQSGRCWLFAGLNLLRASALRLMGLKSFEFSQNFLLFWDKLEKANFFLEAIRETAARPLGDRVVDFLLARPIEDGGQWQMFANLVAKHGLAPKAAMPDTESAGNTGLLNALLMAKLRAGARALREAAAAGAPPARQAGLKREILGAVWRILAVHLGEPPQRFDWQWRDKRKRFHRQANLTPREFARRWARLPLAEYACLVHDPRPTSPPDRAYTVQYLGNVAGAAPVVYLNVALPLIKKLALRALRAGEPVWFGCDVRQQFDRQRGIWDADLRDYSALYETDFPLDKAGRLAYGHTSMTHAMLFTGVDLVRGRPRRWRVENSWGDKDGDKGFYLMNDSWFDEHLFEIAARRRYLPARLRRALAEKPIVLPPWDPMGALAVHP